MSSEPHAYCTEHDQPLDWCMQGVEGVTPHHGGEGAGWYLKTASGWTPITDAEAANERYEGMRHFMHDPRAGAQEG